jgi:hypothetical protein
LCLKRVTADAPLADRAATGIPTGARGKAWLARQTGGPGPSPGLRRGRGLPSFLVRGGGATLGWRRRQQLSGSVVASAGSGLWQCLPVGRDGVGWLRRFR